MLKEDLSRIAGEEDAATDEFELEFYTYDVAPLPRLISSLFRLKPEAVVKPESTREVSEVLEYADRLRIPVTPRGTATSGLGGSIPVSGGIVLDTGKMNRILEIDDENKTVTLQPGVNYEKLLDALERRGYTLATYPSSTPSATVGGWLSTGGLGIGSLKHGHVSEQIVGLEVALPGGKVVKLRRNDESDAGIDLKWFLGSEGTLGIITSATLRVLDKPEVTSPHMVCFKSIEAMGRFISETAGSRHKPHSIECFDRGYIEIEKSMGLPSPDAEGYCIVAFEGASGRVREEESWMRDAMFRAGGWEERPEMVASKWKEIFRPLRVKRAGPTLVPSEVIVPLRSFGEIVEEVDRMRTGLGMRIGVYGSVVAPDSIAVMPMALVDERKKLQHLSTLPLAKKVIDVGLEVGGKPYGIGLWNSFYLNKTFGRNTIEEMKRRKSLLDPGNIMNRGKFFGARTRFGFNLPPFLYSLSISLLGLLRTLS